MSVATYVQTAIIKTVMAGEHRGGMDDAFAEIGECLRGFEGRPRWILSHDRAVEQRLPHVTREGKMGFTAISSD